MNLFQMLFLRIDPFAVYQAELALHDTGIDVPRTRLVNHYLVKGQLRTLAECFRESGKAKALDAIFADDLIHGPNEYANRRFVAPFLLASVCVGHVLLFILAIFFLGLRSSAFSLPTQSYLNGGIVCAVLIILIYAYFYFGAWIGRAKAQLLGLVILAVIVLAAAIFVQIFPKYSPMNWSR